MMRDMMVRTAALLIVGDEILNGEVEDRNTRLLTRGLWNAGIEVERALWLRDRPAAIARAVAEAAGAADLVFVCGGIGPTHDDCTRPAVGSALGLPLERHSEAEERLRRAYGERLEAADLEMADLPRGARLVVGRRSGVFGFQVERVVVLPGIPELLEDILETALAGLRGPARYREEIAVPCGEGILAPLLREVQGHYPDVAIGSYPTLVGGRFRVRLVLRSLDRIRLDSATEELKGLLGAVS